jgi:ammonia channel protein AmtB
LVVSKWRILTIVLAIVSAALLAVAIVYWVTPAGSLPSFFLGHTAGSTHVHVKHGVAAFIAAILVGLGAWFSSAKWQPAPAD